MKERVLQMLREAQGDLSGTEASSRLGVSRTAVWKAVEALRREGYGIASHPGRGYRLLSTPQRLSAREIRAHMGDHSWASLVQVLETVDSTNTAAKALAAQGAPQGTAVLAERQTGGRGRLGRQFDSPPGMGVYLSVVLRPEAEPQRLLPLTCFVAAALCDAVEEAAGLRPKIKWTNDLLLGGRKLAGILTEMTLEAESNKVQYAVVGVGINCGQREADFPPALRETACSLAMAGRRVDRSGLAAAMLLHLAGLSQSLLSGQAEWMQKYRNGCVTIGRQVRLLRDGACREGLAMGVDDQGALLVDFGDGRPRPVRSGEVSIRGLHGYV